MKIFLTGGTGFIGRKFIQQALKKKHTIYALTRKNMKKKNGNLKWLKGYLDQDWSKYLQASDVLVHMAATGVNEKISLKNAINVNLTQSKKLLLSAKKNNCINWVIVGSASEYGKRALKKKELSKKTTPIPITPYEKSKYLLSKFSILFSKKNKINCRVLRLFNVYGDGENNKRLWPSLKKAALNGKDFLITNGLEIRDFINVDDASKKILEACNFKIKNNKFPQIWHIASGNAISVKAFAELYWKKFNAKGKIIFGRIQSRMNKNYISDRNSIWKI